tara:strand:- start:27575 stop:27847 length:273 start_codon:yes stop_codon:yes gene_type:complete
MSTITKTDIAQQISENFGMTKRQIGEVIDLFLDGVKEHTAAGDVVRLNGFGKFEQRTRPARLGRNPRTGESIQIAESHTLAFKASKSVKS